MRQRPVRSGGSSPPDQMMWVVRSDEGGDGQTKMGTNPDNDVSFALGVGAMGTVVGEMSGPTFHDSCCGQRL